MGRGTVLITGASSGIGRDLARVCARHGHDLVVVARRAERLADLARELQAQHGVAVHAIAMDLSPPEAPEELYRRVREEGIQVEYLVNNAGFAEYGFFTDIDWERERALIQLNVAALTHLCKLWAREMRQRGEGHIVNLASTAAFQAGPLMAVYFATKAYVLHFSEAIANELKGSGVRVTALCPGPTRSGFEEAAHMEGRGLFSIWPQASSTEVAEFAYRAMVRGRRVAVHGLLNKVLAFATRLAPRPMATAILRALQRE